MKGKGAEWKLAEKPTLQYLQTLGYEFIDPSEHDSLRASPNLTLFKPHLVEALQRLNNISQSDAEAAFTELQGKDDNEEWFSILRGAFARTVEGQRTQQTLRVIDFQNPENNRYHTTHQLYIKAEKSRIPDIIVYVNGIPLVVIEAKSPLSGKDKNGEAFDQIKQYERDVPRLFATNAFSIVTDGVSILYGATGAPSKFYGYWRDEWPRSDPFANELEKGLWCLLEPSRLLDFIAHFIVFENDAETGNIIKKMCRYQQYRAVNKMVQRVVDGEHNKGLVWHTQGSGKSLTMVFAALKLKNHLTVSSPRLANPNLMVLTDRIDLDDQISATFQACGLANPTRVSSIQKLRTEIDAGVDGKTLLSTIYKFEGSKRPIPNSANWIVMVDECHRTQEKDLGAYLRATMPDATFFGFTGTPVKKTDRDTYSNFSVGDERYLDKYGIDDAVRDGATVPIYYTGRKTDWHIDETKLDMMFDTWFSHLDEAELAEVKKRGVHVADLVKHPQRVDLIAFDLWNHFRAYAKPDGFKAQIVAYDREAIVLYKRALDAEITKFLRKQGMDAEEAAAEADAMTACVFSKSQEDDKPTEDIYDASIRKDLQRWYLDRDDEKDIKRAFSKRGQNPQFLIVCDKLLTGFDAPAESVMYLDKPLKEHSLLQAIARTNRVSDAKKKCGLIVDYIGISKKLDEALSSYRNEDVDGALTDLDDLRNQLKSAHTAVLKLLKGIKRNGRELKAEYDALVQLLETEDQWIAFQTTAKTFIALYEALSPDPSVLDMSYDLKWVAGFLVYGRQVFEKKEGLGQTDYSEKIREMLEDHLQATGITTVVKLRSIVDEDFWDDFKQEGKTEDELATAAIRKTTELRKTTEAKIAENYHQYAKFSDRLRELIQKMDDAQLSWSEKLKAAEEFAKDLEAEANAHKGTGLSEGAYAVQKVLEALSDAKFKPETCSDLARVIEILYTDTATAPVGWQTKEEVRKQLRQLVRKTAHAAGFPNLTEMPNQVEDVALKFFVGGSNA